MKISAQRNKENSIVTATTTNSLHNFSFPGNNRPEASLQRKIQSQSDTSLAVVQARLVQNRVNTSPQVKQLKAIQVKAANFRTGQGTGVVQQIKDTDGKKLTTKQFWNKYKSKFQGTGVGYTDIEYDLDENGWHDSTVKKFLVHHELIEDDSRSNGDDSTYKGARVVGDSGALARGRYNRSKKKSLLAFAKWKLNREAQHLIPASLHRTHPALKNIVDIPENGMMLPATYHKTNKKPTHRRPNQYDHKPYTKNVGTLLGGVKKRLTKKALDQKELKLIMNALRAVNKNNSYKYIDDIPYSVFKMEWNNQNSTLTL
ncbi:AHH domain-containing protein [Spirosoma sp.]|uniref:AHH domain-containing protein n=1 Tax=Spirosoma sp. TaxID=1899569 RepID=UPI0026394557|nr:AHH domain-containing protein [Spirosoma sp.]MCX6219078.1 hypothetical protein [Spirosoma sp.]